LKKKWIYLVFLAFFTSALFSYFTFNPVRESIIYFPIDDSITFTKASTSLELVGNKDDDEYLMEWDVHSQTDKEVYLRQDISLLFSNGKLIETLSEWEDQSQKIAQYKKISGEDSAHYEAISLHYGEIHLKDEIRSTQYMTSDQLYIIDSEFTNLFSFKSSQTEEEEEWEKILNKVTEQHLEYSWTELIDYFQIDSQDYFALPLSELAKYNSRSLLQLTKAQTKEVVGSLWEGLYKHYFLGIKTKEGKVLSPIGSTMPLILLANNHSHMLVLTQTEDGTPIKLVQKITFNP